MTSYTAKDKYRPKNIYTMKDNIKTTECSAYNGRGPPLPYVLQTAIGPVILLHRLRFNYWGRFNLTNIISLRLVGFTEEPTVCREVVVSLPVLR